MNNIIAETDMHAGIDINGKPITVGSKVRSHDFAFGLKGRTMPIGLDREGPRAAYVEGVLEAISEVEIEGCPRYSIRPCINRRGDEVSAVQNQVLIHPPLNGTPSIMGGVTCGIELIEAHDEWDHDGAQTWYARLPETELEHFWEPESTQITKDSSGYWLSEGEGLPQTQYDSLEEAKDAVFWDSALAYYNQHRNLHRKYHLGREWNIDLSDGIAFRRGEGEAEESITGCMSSACPTWNAWTEKGQVPGDHADPAKALKALESHKASQGRKAA